MGVQIRFAVELIGNVFPTFLLMSTQIEEPFSFFRKSVILQMF